MMTTGLMTTKVSLSDKLTAIVSEQGVIPFEERVFHNSPLTKIYYRPTAIVTLLYCGDPTNRNSYQILYSALYTDCAIDPEKDECASVDVWNAIGCVLEDFRSIYEDPAEFLSIMLDGVGLTPAQFDAINNLRISARNYWPQIKEELRKNLPALCRVQHDAFLDNLLLIFPEMEKFILQEARKAS